MDRRAKFAGPVKQHLVERVAPHLPGLSTLAVLVLVKIERCRWLHTFAEKLNAVFSGVSTFLKPLDKSQAFERPVRFRNQ